MKYHTTSTALAGSGALALALLLAGCGGGGAPLGSSPTGLVPNLSSHGSAGAFDDDVMPDKGKRRVCKAVTNSQNFNGTAIAKGDWIWFSSVTSFPGNNSDLKISMRQSKITFTAGSTKYVVHGPAMRLRIGPGLSFTSEKRSHHHPRGRFLLDAPLGTAGNDLLNAIAYQVPADLPGGIKNVTWSAKFYTRSTIKAMHWQWGAAVYTQLTSDYANIGVKPLDDNHYPPYSSDHAGTPENFTQYLTAGATGGGGSNYTGGYSGTVEVTPCK